MKKKLNLIIAIFLTCAALNLSSCLKDDSHYIDFAGSPPTVELPLTAPGAVSSGPFVPEPYNISATPTLLPLIVNLASPSTLKTAVTVTLALDTADLNAYNTANGTHYTLLPDTDYSVSGWTVTIPAGQREVPLNISVKTASVDPAGSFVLPIKIVSASVTINQFNYILYNIGVKNAYDDNYTATGYVFHPSAPRAIAATYAVTTINAIRSQAPLADLAGNGFYFQFDVVPNNTSVYTLANWGAADALYAAPASGFMTEDNPGNVTFTGVPSQPGGAVYNSTIYNNTYNKSTKTFWMHFGYASGATDQSGYTRQFYMELVAK
jgi:hypothetical protein